MAVAALLALGVFAAGECFTSASLKITRRSAYILMRLFLGGQSAFMQAVMCIWERSAGHTSSSWHLDYRSSPCSAAILPSPNVLGRSLSLALISGRSSTKNCFWPVQSLYPCAQRKLVTKSTEPYRVQRNVLGFAGRRPDRTI